MEIKSVAVAACNPLILKISKIRKLGSKSVAPQPSRPRRKKIEQKSIAGSSSSLSEVASYEKGCLPRGSHSLCQAEQPRTFGAGCHKKRRAARHRRCMTASGRERPLVIGCLLELRTNRSGLNEPRRGYSRSVSRYWPVPILSSNFWAQRLLIVRPARPSIESSKSLSTNISRSQCSIWDLVATVVPWRIRNSTIVVARSRTDISAFPCTASLERKNRQSPTNSATLIRDCPPIPDRTMSGSAVLRRS